MQDFNTYRPAYRRQVRRLQGESDRLVEVGDDGERGDDGGGERDGEDATLSHLVKVCTAGRPLASVTSCSFEYPSL